MGEHARTRLTPTFDGAIGAAGGALVGGGLIAVGGGDDGSRGGIAAGAVVLIVVGALVRLSLGTDWRAVRTAGVALGVAGIAALAAVAPSPESDGFLRVFLLLATLGFAVAWLAPGYRGHPVMLGVALLTFAGLVAELLAGGGDDGGLGGPFGIGVGGVSTATGQILLVAGLGYLVGVWLADRRAYVGVGTAFAVASLVSIAIGAAIVAAELGDAGGSFLVLTVGAIVCAVGAASDRRATAWWGAALCGGGAAGFTVSLLDPSTTSAAGITVALTGAALVAAVTLLPRGRPGTSSSAPMTPPPSPLPPPTG